jgi:transposase
MGFAARIQSFGTLAGVVRESLRLDPLSGHLFVFTNSRKNRIKILFWDNTDWWLWAKRLEAGTLAWPVSPTPSIELSSEELTLLLSGIDLSKTHRRPWLHRGAQNGPAQHVEKHSKPS